MAKPERDALRDHEYDGIQEYDNPQPGWWTLLFAATVAFSLVYFVYYELGPGASVVEAYEQDLEAFRRAHPAVGSVELDEAELERLVADPDVVARGRDKFRVVCAACHGQRGEGIIGPNLTDDYWLHGGRLVDILKSIRDGVPDKGMPTWGRQLGADELAAVVAYVGSLRGTNVPGKEPQGERFVPEAK